jgi:hypothetical protein
MTDRRIQEPKLGEVLMLPGILPVEGQLAHELANRRLGMVLAQQSWSIYGTYIDVIPLLLVLLAFQIAVALNVVYHDFYAL